MSVVLLRCPETAKTIATRIEVDFNSLKKSWKKALRVPCPHCGEEHAFSMKEAYITSTLSQENLHGASENEAGIQGLAARLVARG